jgi:hypothetical protein
VCILRWVFKIPFSLNALRQPATGHLKILFKVFKLLNMKFYMSSEVCLETIKFAIAFIAALMSTLVGSISQMNV